ncbi:GTP pyrophosphokinase family protein [Saccharibacillus sp. VR-M41]|uniref:GTP pyrophosphokinase family protein n=2 Tax=Saccharibacillus alkalitolerans TaxID=2705290 RepID=A0ABX0F952_9BACL|nr:GTP pyrophosphokinase family protein [Saccharibacillus alkalitolerans]
MHRQALRQLRGEIERIRREWKSDEGFSPIEHIKTRIKEPASILDKLSRLGLEPSVEHVTERIHDIAGMRIVFAFVTDIYLLLDRIDRHPDLRILWIKDYIMNPKSNGYRSLHMLLSVPVEFEGRTCRVRIEVQMRTLAMDFWASLEHILLYKYDRRVPDYLERELSSAAGAAGELDHKMLALRSEVLSLGEEEERSRRSGQSFMPGRGDAGKHRAQTLHGPEKSSAPPHKRAASDKPPFAGPYCVRSEAERRNGRALFDSNSEKRTFRL